MLLLIRNVGSNLELIEMTVTTFYFDGSDMSATDMDGAWNNEANSDDGNSGTYAVNTTPIAFTGEPSNYAIVIFGTNASGSDSVLSVRARIHNGTGWGDYVAVSSPSGGWDWSKLAELKCFTQYGNVEGRVATFIYEASDWEGTILANPSCSPVSEEGRISRIEIEVTHGTPVNIKAGNGSIGANYVGQTYIAGTPKLSQIFAELFEDAIGLVDTKVVKPFKTFVESLGLTESFAKVGDFVRSFTEALGITDSKTADVETTKADAITLTDSHTSVLSAIRNFVDSIDLSEVFSKFTNKVAFVEGIVLSEIQSVVKVFVVLFQDGITLVEEFASDMDKFFSRVFTETMALTDSWSRVLDKLVAFVDSLSIADTVSKILPSKLFSDGVELADSTAKAIAKAFTETVIVIESFVKKAIKNLAEALSLTDTFDSIKSKIREFIDSIVLEDTGSVAQIIVKIFTDTIELADSTTRAITKAFTEAISFVDSHILTPVKTFIDGIDLSESIVKSVNIILSSTIALGDSIVRRLNGMILNWEKTGKDLVDWTKRTRQVVATTKIGRVIADWTKRNRQEVATTKIGKDEKEWTKFKGINDHD